MTLLKLAATLLLAALIAAAIIKIKPDPLVQSREPFVADPRWCFSSGDACHRSPVPC